MQVELDKIEKNETWQFVDRSRNLKVIGVKWIFKTKFNSNGSICTNKARSMRKWCTQPYCVDYPKTFALIARYDTIRLNLAYASHNFYQIHQLDVKLTFLNDLLNKKVST